MKNHSFNIRHSSIAIYLILTITACAQTQRKTYKESFNVNEDVTIDINTSYTDIVFETWNKDRVDIEATIEVEGVSEEEAEEYFERWGFSAKGNSREIDINANSNTRFAWKGDKVIITGAPDVDWNVVAPDLTIDIREIEPFIVEIPPLPPMPPMPPTEMNFDYDRYKKYGDDYLEEWSKNFEKNFGEEWKEAMMKWQKEVEALQKEREKTQEEHEKMREERMKAREEMLKAREEAIKEREEARREMREERKRMREEKRNFYIYSQENSNLKTKKAVKITMPKGAKLRMNVRHGEVKLSDNLKDIRATLHHTGLLADVIDGEQTLIEVSYSPVEVNQWNYGKLLVNFADRVDLKNVQSLKLDATSSDVIIGALKNNALINANLGALQIDEIVDTFKALDVRLENTDTVVLLPTSSYDFYYSGNNSEVEYPSSLTVKTTENFDNKIIKGYHKSRDSDKSINITSMYSDVVLKE